MELQIPRRFTSWVFRNIFGGKNRHIAARALAATGVFLVAVSMVLTAFPAVPAEAAINRQINFQGKVTNPNGTNVTNGNYSFTFRIYTVASGGTHVWTETKTLAVNDGIFVTALGDTTTLPGSVDFNTDNIYLGINFNSDGEMTPRIRFTSAAYAFNADMLDGLDSSALAQLNPSSAQSGSLNVTGSVQAATSIQAPLVDTASAVALNIGTGTASSVTVGRATSSTNLTLQGSASTSWSATGASGSTTVNFAAPTATNVITFPNAGGTVCTTVASTCSATYQAAGNYLAKNATDTTSASNASGPILSITNTNPGGGRVLDLTNAGTGSTLNIVTSGNPGAGAALLKVNNNATTPSGNLLELQSNGTSRFTINVSGNVSNAGTYNGQTISSAAVFTGTVTVQGANALTLGVTGTSTGAVLFKGATAASGTVTLSGPANPTGSRAIALPDADGTVCLQSSAACGFLTGTAADYINNQSSVLQQANFSIQSSAAAGTPTAVIQAASGQTGNLIEFKTSAGGSAVSYVTSSGVLASTANILGVGLANLTSANNALVAVGTSGTTVSTAVAGNVALKIQNTATPTVDLLQVLDTAGTTPLVKVNSAGNVGIGTGTATLGSKLDVQGTTSAATLGTNLLTNGDFATGDFTGWTAGAGWAVSSGAAQHTAGNTAALSQSVSVTSGNVYQIDFTQTGATAGDLTFALGSANIIWRYFTTPTGVVLTAATTGTVTFSITPSSNYDGAIDSITVRQRTAFASAVARALNSDGTVGLEVRSGGSALGNMFIGTNAGRATSTGTNNVALGTAALQSNMTGTSNVAVGLNALLNNTSGSLNTAVGQGALQNNTNGTQNTAFGSSALPANTTGYYNTAVGRGALLSNTTGTQNTALGLSALANITSGADNVGVGLYAGLYNTTGSRNTYVGKSAGIGTAANASNNNTFIGNTAGGAITTGSNNVFLGLQAGDNVTTGGNNIVIGYDVDAPSATGSNQLNIGNLLFGTTINGTGTTLSTGNIGIGTTSPGAKLTVAGSASGTSVLQVRGASGQSVNMFEIQDSTSAVLASFGSNGQLVLGRSAVSGTQQTGSVALVDGSNTSGWAATLSTGALTNNRAINLPDANGTVCLQNSAACGFVTGSAGSFLARNAQDTSTASVTGNLLSFSNTNGSGGVLSLSNSGTNSALTITQSSNPGSGQALIYANNSDGTPTGNLIDLRSGGVSRFSVTAAGATTMAQALTVSAGGISVTGNSTITGTLGGLTGLTVASGGASISGGINNNTGGITNTGAIAGATTIAANNTVTLSGTGANQLAVTGAPAQSATSSLIQVGSAIAGGNAVANGGTYLGLNAPGAGAGSAADFLNFQSNGTSRVRIDISGNITAGTYNGQTISSAASFTGSVTVANALTVTAGGASISGGINNNNGGMTNAGAISGATTVTASTSLQAPVLDTNGSGTLAIGGTNATSTTVGRAAAPLTMQGNGSTTLSASDSGNTTTVGFATPTANVNYNFATTTAGTYTICTTSVASCGSVYQAAGNYIAKNAQDSSSASVAGTLLSLTNSNAAGSVLLLSNSGSNSTLSVTASNNPTSGQALIFANNTNGTPSGNLMDLQSGGSSRLSVSTGGTLTLGGTPLITSGAGLGMDITANAASTWSTTAGNLLIQSAANLNLGNGGGSTINIGTNNAAHQITVGNTTGSTGIQQIIVGSSLHTSSTLSLEAGTGAGAIQIGNGNTAHGIQIGTGTAIQTIAMGSQNSTSTTAINGGSGASGVGAISLQAASGGLITLGTANNNPVTIGGASSAVRVGSLGASTANGTAVCRDSSTSQLLSCDTNTSGRPFLQGGNSFGATANLGTNDAQGLDVRTGGTTRMSIGSTGGVSLAAGNNLTMQSGTGVFSQSYSGTSDAHTISATSLTTGSALRVVSSNNSAANTAWSGIMMDVSNVQATTAVSTGTIAGLDLQFAQTAGVTGNTETVANFAVKANSAAATDATVSSIINVVNNDTATGNQITVTDGIRVNGAGVTNGLNLSGTFGTSLITSTNFSVSQGGAIVGVGVNSGTGLIQGTGGATVTGAINLNNNAGTGTTNIGTGSTTGQVTIGGGTAPLVIDSTNFDVSSAGALSGITTITTSSTINTNTFTGSALNFGSASQATIQAANSQTLQVGANANGNTLALRGSQTSNWLVSNGTNTTQIGFVNPTANVVYNFGTAPAATYTICTTYVSSCSATYAPAQDGTGYIQNDTTLQATANYNIDGSGRVGGSMTIGTDSTGTAFGTGADLMFGNNANRTVKVLAAAASQAGKNLTMQAGDGNGAGQAGGNLLLQGGAAGSGGSGGTVIVRSQTNSTTAFTVQNSSNTAIFTVDTSSGSGAGIVLIGNATNYARFETTNELTLGGTARHQKKIRLNAEYVGAVLDADGTNNTGTMTAAFDATPRMGYYRWTTGQATNQDYDVVVTVPVPDDWSAWNGNPEIDIYESATAGSFTATITKTDGTTDANWNAITINPAAASAWTNYNSTAIASTGYTAGGYMTIRIKMTAPTNQHVRLGDIELPYFSKW